MVDITNLIIQKIALEGEKVIQAKLEALRKAGEKTFAGIDSTKATKSLAELQQGLVGTERAAVAFGFAIRDVGNEVASSFGAMAKAGTALVAVTTLVGVSIFGIAKSAANAADAIRDSSIRAGTTTDRFQELSHAFDQSGGKAAGLDRTLNTLNDTIGDELVGKSTEATKKFKELNIALLEGGKGRDVVDVLLDVADKIEGITNPAERAQTVIALFGKRVGPQLVELLSLGRKGIQALGSDLDALGAKLTPLQIKLGDQLNDALDRVGKASAGTANKLGLLFAPSIINAANRFAESTAKSQARLLALGETVVQFVTPVIEDLISIIVGEPEKIQSSFFVGVQKVIDGLILAVNGVIFIFKGLLVILDQIAFALNTVFGTQFSGAALAAILIIGKLTGAFRILASVLTVVRFGFLLVAAASGIAAAPLLGMITTVTLLGVALGLLAVWLTGGKLDFNTLSTRAKEAFDAIKSGAMILWELLTALWNDGIAGLVKKWEELKLTQKIIDFIKAEWQKFVVSVEQNFGIAVEKIRGLLSSFAQWFASTWVGQLLQALDKVIRKLLEVGRRQREVEAESGGEGGGEGFARGGLVRGRGSSTSDLIPAWLSNLEFVHRARAVRYYGLDFMRAINNLQIPRFAEGGLVQRAAPLKFASPNRVETAAMRPLAVHFDGMVFDGLLAPNDVADQMVQASTNRQLRSAGRKPTYYGSRK